MKLKRPNFFKNSNPKGSKVAASTSQVVTTSTVSVPPNHYGQSKKRKRR